MTNLAFTMVQRDRLITETPAERAIRAARFRNAGSADDTEGARATEEYQVFVPGAIKVRHPLNYLWAVCMGRQM